jgi:hypothetical protein
MNAVAAGTGFIAKFQIRAILSKLFDQLLNGLSRIGNLPNEANLCRIAGGHRYRDGFFMHIHSYVLDKLTHDLSPQFRLCAFG